MQISNTLDNNSDELKLTMFIYSKAVENFPLDKRGSYSLIFSNKIYKIRENILDYSDYLSHYFEANLDIKELTLTFNYATSIEALDIVMKLLFGFNDVIIPNEEYIQVLAFIYELSN